MRDNRRYLLVKGAIEDSEKSILDFVGVLGMSKSGFSWIKKGKDLGILSVTRESVNEIRASFAVWPKEIKITKVSGTLKGLEKK